ncbi:unnamed protein product [Meganyctiphanes norvegica]|uniref:Uncharacterized protein n=1 Tax=Meganyctiphanes norvegica TaxID=48144 RepID=A0AAV2SMY9_MEGNR
MEALFTGRPSYVKKKNCVGLGKPLRTARQRKTKVRSIYATTYLHTFRRSSSQETHDTTLAGRPTLEVFSTSETKNSRPWAETVTFSTERACKVWALSQDVSATSATVFKVRRFIVREAEGCHEAKK